MISFETITFNDKNDLEVKAIKKRIRKSGLHIKDGAMDVLTDPEIYTLNSLNLIVLVSLNNVLIGWASVISGFSEKNNAKDGMFSTYPHVGVYINPKNRGKGFARQALDVLLDFYKNNNLKKEYRFKTFGYSVSEKIFKPSLNRFKLKSTWIDALPVSRIEIHFED